MAYLGSVIFFLVLTIIAMTFDFMNFTINMFNVVYFIDIPSFLIVFPPSLLFGIVATSPNAFVLSLQMAFGNPQQVTPEDAKEVSKFLEVVGDTSLLMGIFGAFIGGIIMLWNLANPAAIGPAAAIMILSLFYATLHKLLCYVANHKVINNYLEE